jgi:NHLM bacteriocin system ABC transporter ATP-binding protein
MPNLWVQHDTIIAARSQAEVRDLFRPGEIRDLSANHPFYIMQSKGVWYVHQGGVDLFFVSLGAGGVAGRRYHVARVPAGELFLAMEGIATDTAKYGVLAVALNGTKAAALDQSELRTRAEGRNAMQALDGLVDAWVRRLLGALPRRSPPPQIRDLHPEKAELPASNAVAATVDEAPALDPELMEAARQKAALARTLSDEVSAGMDVRLPIRAPSTRIPERAPARASGPLPVVELAPQSAVRAGPKSLWIRVLEGTALLLGVTHLDGVSVIPLSREVWLAAQTRVRLQTIDVASHLRADRDWISIRRFHGFLMRCLIDVVDQEDARGRRLLEERSDFEARSLHRSLTALAGVKERRVAVAEEDPLVAVLQRIGDAVGVHLNLAGRPVARADQPPLVRLEELVQVSQLRARRVLLRPRWWKTGCDAMVAFAGSEHSPVAVLPRPFGGYEIFDPLTRARYAANETTASNLLPDAHALYPALPARALGLASLWRLLTANAAFDLLLIVAAGALGGLLGLAAPFVTQEVIDTIIPSAETGLLLQTAGLLFAVAVALMLVNVVRGAAMLRFENRSGSRLQVAVWDRLLRLPVAFFRNYTAGDLALRATGINTIRRALSGGAMAALLGGVFSVFNLVVMLRVDVQLTLLAVALVFGGVLVVAGLGAASIVTYRTLATLEGSLSSLVLQLISGIAKLKVAGAERRAFAVWSWMEAEKRQISLRAQRYGAAAMVFNAAYPVLTSLVIFDAMDSRSGSMSTGAFLSFNAALAVFTASTLGLAEECIALLGLLPTYERARPLFEAVPEVDEKKGEPGELEGEIHVSRLSFRYGPRSPRILDEVDFHIERGEFVAVVGSSGAGKSTLLRMLLGFESPEAGSVFFDRKDLASLDLAAVRRQIGVVLQSGQPIAASLLDNILGARNLGMAAAWEAAKMAGLSADIERMPMGMHTVIGQGGGGLSGGQRQRLMIARALVNKPKMIFFDEATGALDNAAQAIVTENLERLRATRVVIAHRLSTIRNADRIIVLSKGRIAEIGTYDELMAQAGVFTEIARRQLA